jgi:hypothetical protein
LEQHKKIVHIRVSNSNDLIPCALPLPGYTHTGVNLHFCEKAENGYELASGDHNSSWTQLSFDPGSRHGLADYHRVKSACKDKFGNKTIEEIYYDPDLHKRISKVTIPFVIMAGACFPTWYLLIRWIARITLGDAADQE